VTIEEYADEKELVASSLSKSSTFVGIVFKDFMSYELRFFPDTIPVFFALMLTPLFKKSKHVGIVEFLVTVAFGFVGLLVVLMESFPRSLVWLLSPFCQCTFLIGVTQVMHLEDVDEGALFSNLTEGPYPLIITLMMLILNSIFYILLAVYLDQVIPGEFGLRRSSFYFLKPSYWSKSKRNYKELSEGNMNGNVSFSEIVEPVSSEFIGKEAIRISGIQKTHRKKGENVEALRSLSFDIYEGQITALLGHSGTGKSTLMNILCGLCPPSDGFASIYGHRVSEIDEMFEARKMIGICPQLDIHFDVLTVEENLSILASVKGIPANAVIQEVLLLDEPTAGMDPCSRHIVWNLLRYRKANRVTVFSTHFMDEADILAESLSSLVEQHVPAATVLQQSEQQIVYSLPFKDMDKFSGIPSSGF
ncbi:hypothetical protein Celaphus_00001682, partial [Cervus elaphus hippelaphus]